MYQYQSLDYTHWRRRQQVLISMFGWDHLGKLASGRTRSEGTHSQLSDGEREVFVLSWQAPMDCQSGAMVGVWGSETSGSASDASATPAADASSTSKLTSQPGL
jgi:hypothetical protein